MSDDIPDLEEIPGEIPGVRVAKCVICGKPTTRTTREQVTGQELPAPAHEQCERKARRNSMYGRMAGNGVARDRVIDDGW